MVRMKYLGKQRRAWRNKDTSNLYHFGPKRPVRFVDTHDAKFFLAQRDAGGHPLFAEAA